MEPKEPEEERTNLFLERVARNFIRISETTPRVVLAMFPVVGALAELLGHNAGPKEPKMDEKLTEAARTLAEASRYMDSLQARLQGQLEEIKATQAELEHHKALNRAERSSAAAFLAELNRGQVKERAWSFWLGLAGNVVVFLIGVALSEEIRNGWLWLKRLIAPA